MSSSKTIAKNSAFLYLRMFLSMGVGLYTSRVVLNTLGIEDFGVYNIVGGIVVLFGFFNNAMSSATQRFLSFDIGKNDFTQLNKTFNATLNIHFLIAIIVLVLAETVGLWFVNYKLNLPDDRMYAVNWVYQFSVLTFLFGIIQVPYNALIIARERMNVYAYISIFEVVFKLLIVYLLVVVHLDKLILYAFLLFLIAFVVRIIEKWYCKKNFEESKYSFHYDKEYTKTLLAYSGWNLFGNVAAIARSQGNNIILNLFYGAVLNASYGIAMQVQGVVSTFVSNFQMAVNPQIIKQYATGNIEQSIKLMIQSSKFSFYIMSLLVFPILFNTKYILQLWLKTVPEYTIVFVQLSLIGILIDTISGPLMTGIQATGKIKFYQIIVGTLIFLNLPFSYIGISFLDLPEVVFLVSITISFLAMFFRLYFLYKALNFNVLYFIKEVVFKIFIISLIVILIKEFFISNLAIEQRCFLNFIFVSVMVVVTLIILIYTIGLSKNEKEYAKIFMLKLKTKVLK